MITGAAGAIGRAMAHGFMREGASLALVDTHQQRLSELENALAAHYDRERFRVFLADVRSTQQIQEAFRLTVGAFGRLDILVNNAAVTQIKPVDEILDADIDLIIDVNLKGYIKCAREAVQIMKRLKIQGCLLFISSKNGLVGAAEKPLYCASKAGEINLARSLAVELGRSGIRVNTICPDAVMEGSALWDRGSGYLEATAKRYGIPIEKIPEYYRSRSALRTTIEAEDVANAALFLVSDRASKMTGNILTVDGGVAFVR
ncbi:MAG: SDR family oxidoreductase [Armatimonadetes bacterium]|nr:SDR family oxidoreductase [Armatimonadota bacterium]